jgi:hypothetical protein
MRRRGLEMRKAVREIIEHEEAEGLLKNVRMSNLDSAGSPLSRTATRQFRATYGDWHPRAARGESRAPLPRSMAD